MKIDNKKIIESLIQGNYISSEVIKNAEKLANKQNISLYEYLISENLVTKDLLGQAIAESYKISYADLNSLPPSQEQMLKIPEDTAKVLRIVLFSENKDGVTVTTDNPSQQNLIPELQRIFLSQHITISYSLPEDINENLLRYERPLSSRFSKIIEEQQHIAPKILEEIFKEVFAHRASDIHLEPRVKEVVIRLRIDGVLQEVGRIPKEYYENILNRIKVQSNLRIDEHFAAQDGSMRYEKDDKIFDLRISIMPTIEGEKIALRVLASYIPELALSELGLSKNNQETLKETIKKPFGMILVTGPTGSGKTTTLYALLNLLNRAALNITTIEDPVEYRITGINQIQVNPQTNLTFAKGLRSIVRQNPDVILVGEIRDEETAEIAVNAALTGHLLFSTFHANDAATSIPRLIDMNVERFLIASTLEVIIAQRLIRRICEQCRFSISLSQEELSKRFKEARTYFPEKNITIYQGKGCNDCHQTGYRGRTAIFELLHITQEMQELILQNPSTRQVFELARQQGFQSMFEDGIDKVKNGITTIEELLRVAPPR